MTLLSRTQVSPIGTTSLEIFARFKGIFREKNIFTLWQQLLLPSLPHFIPTDTPSYVAQDWGLFDCFIPRFTTLLASFITHEMRYVYVQSAIYKRVLLGRLLDYVLS